MPEITQNVDDLVSGEWYTEREEHVRLKSIGAMVLRSLGFSRDQIDEERRMGKQIIDIVGERDDGSLVMVECETGTPSPPPKRTHVSYNQEQFRQGHQVLALTDNGLYELVDREGDVFHPVQFQASIGGDEVRHIGRWVADGREKHALPVPERPHRVDDSPDLDELPKSMIRDNHERWRANGVEPSKKQPTISEVADWHSDTSQNESESS